MMELARDIARTLGAWLKGALGVVLILSALYAAGLYAIGLPWWWLIGILSGFAYLVPYSWMVAGLLPALVVAYLTFNDMLPLALVLGLFAAMQILESVVITPRVMGKTLALNPWLVMVVILFGGMLFGLPGLILAVPAAAVTKVVLGRLQKRTGGGPDGSGETRG